MKEKVAVLIDKLQKLKEKDATLSELSHYTKLLYAELMCAKSEEDKKNSTRKVSVIMPGYDLHHPQKKVEEITEEAPVPVDVLKENPEENTSKEQEVVAVGASIKSASPGTVQNSQQTLWDQPTTAGDTTDKPSLSARKELNDLIAEHRPSLNDRLKKEQEEVVNKLGNSSVKDLHQAIGLNEKFGFINELFRGDQSLYNRSIKTINECRDLEEALYWIDRELKIKLGWQENNKTVQHFYSLIKKRFS